MELLSLSEERLIILLHVMNNYDEINNFFMNNDQKNRNLREAHMNSLNEMEELKRLQESRVDESMRRRLKIKTLLMNSQPRFRNYRMKLIIWTIRDIFKMLNQFAVDQPTFPVNQRYSHLFRDPGGMLSRPWGERWAAKICRQTFGIRTVYRETFFCKSTGVFLTPYAGGINPWIFNVSEHTSPNVMSERQTPNTARSEMPVRTVSQKFIRPWWGKTFKEFWSRPTTTADLRSSFRKIYHTSNLCLLEDKVQDRGMYLFAISYGSYAEDQRSGVGWFTGWSWIFLFWWRSSNTRFWSTRCEDCFSTEQNRP